MLRPAILVLGLAVAAPAAAQGNPITLAGALEEARQSAPSVLVSAARAAVSDRDVDVAGMLPDPTLGVGMSPSYAFIATLYVSLPIFGQREMRVDAAAAQARVACAGVAIARLDAALAVRTAWTHLWLAQQRVALAEEDVTRRGRIAEAASVRFDEGAGSRLDVLRARADANRARGEQAALTAQRDAASARLVGLLGRPGRALLLAAGEPELGGRAPALSALPSILAAHPLMHRSHATLAAADADVASAHRSRWPELGVSVQDWAGRQSGDHDVRVVLSMQVPIFDEPRISRAEAGRSAVRTEQDAVGIDLRANLAATRAEYIASVRRAEAEASEVLPAAQEAAALSEEAYRSGGLDLTGALAAEQALSAARLSELDARAQRALAYARLVHAAGRAP